MREPTVTVYIPCHRYGRFLAQAIESVLAQSFTNWELLILDDGSQDETAEIAARYQAKHPERVRILRHPSPRGLQACANRALNEARGEHIMRVDADDYLDDHALLVLASYLDAHPDVALVYPNYIYVDEDGRYLGLEQRKRIGEEAQLLDLPAHGAGTMVRRQVLAELGGYDERYETQDGYELWLKILPGHKVANVPTPLFFYRQHPTSVSNDGGRLLDARRRIKRDRVEARRAGDAPRMVAIVTAKNTYTRLPNIALRELAGIPLIDYTLEAAQQVGGFESIVVTTDDPRVVEHCQGRPGIVPMLRPRELSDEQVVVRREVVGDAVRRLEREQEIAAEIIVVLSIHSPLRRAEHIREAIDTLLLYHSDSVVSVYEDYELHYTHGRHGLTPLNPAMHRQIRPEREALYVSNGAIRALWRGALESQDAAGRTTGHIVMSREESFQIKTLFDAWLIEHILVQRAAGAGIPAAAGQGRVAA